MHRFLPVRQTYLSVWVLLLVLSCLFSANPAFAQAQASTAQQTTRVDDALQRLQQEAGAFQLRHHRATGLISFLRLTEPATFATRQAQETTPEAKALAFFNQYGAMFGITTAGAQLELRNIVTDSLGGNHLIYQQVHQGVEVFGGQLRVHFDAVANLTAVNGVAVPDLQLSTTPAQSAQAATQVAIATVAKQPATRNLSVEWAVLNTHLYIFRTGLVQGVPGNNHLAYAVEVANPQRTIQEVVYVDAHSGQVLDQISLVENIDRKVYHGDFDPTLLVWSEGDPQPYSGPAAPDINNLINFSEATYNLFATLSGGTFLSWDGAEATMHSDLRHSGPR